MNIVEIGNCKLINADCEEAIKTLETDSVTLIHTDPPYLIHTGAQKSKMFEEKGINKHQTVLAGSGMVEGFNVEVMFPEFKRVCKAVNYQIWCSKKQFIDYLMMAHFNKWKWQDIHLFRNNALPMVNGKYQDGDYLVHMWDNRKLTGSYRNKITDYHWNIGGKKEWNHPTLKPVEPIMNMLPVGSNEGDVVLDPFMGSGTTGVACIRTNRKFIGIERNEEYFNMAVERIKKELE